MCIHTYSDRSPQYTWIYVEYTHKLWPLWRYILHYLRIHSGYTSIHKYMPKYSCNTVMIHVLCVRRKNSVRIYACYTHTLGPYFTYIAGQRPEYLRNTPRNTRGIQRTSVCIHWGHLNTVQIYSNTHSQHIQVVPYFTCRRSAPGIPKEYTSQYTQNTTRVRVYSLGAHLNTDSYTQVCMYLERIQT